MGSKKSSAAPKAAEKDTPDARFDAERTKRILEQRQKRNAELAKKTAPRGEED